MKKLVLYASWMVLSFAAMAQKSLFIGMHATYDNEDTAIRVFISYDSVKMITSAPKKNKDLWLQVKYGIWKIKSGKENDIYTVTFFFNDGTSQDVKFHPTYRDKDALPPPDHYTMYIGHTRLSKMLGKGSFAEEVVAPLKQQINTDNAKK